MGRDSGIGGLLKLLGDKISEMLKSLEKPMKVAIPEIEANIQELNKIRNALYEKMVLVEQSFKNKVEELTNQSDLRDAIIRKDKERLEKMYEEVCRLRELISPPNSYGTFLRVVSKRQEAVDPVTGREVEIPAQVDILDQCGRMSTVNVEKNIDVDSLRNGQRLRLTPQGNVLMVLNEFAGEKNVTAVVSNIRPERKVLVRDSMENFRILRLADNVDESKIKIGMKVIYNPASEFVVDYLIEEEKSSLQMDEVKEVTFDMIGGLKKQIKEFEDQILYPRLHLVLFSEYKIKLPKGVALYGPPGCGKTLLARAAAYRIKTMGQKVVIFVGNGPEFLIKWVGDSEHKVREPAEYAKTHSDTIVMYIVDEIDSICKTRGSVGGHGGVNDSIVTQFNSLLDGFVEIPNLIFVGITNRLDLIDSSMLRPGRMDLHLKISRPDRESTASIMRVHLTKDIPFDSKYFDEKEYPQLKGDPRLISEHLISKAVERIFGTDGIDDGIKRKVATIEFSEDGERRDLFMKDFISGALLADIVNRAKILSVHAVLSGDKGADDGLCTGFRARYLYRSIENAYANLKDQIGRDNSREWARMVDLPEDKPFIVISKEEDIGVENKNIV